MIQTIVGISFNKTKDDTIKTGTEVNIYHDKGNKYSSRAIAVTYNGKLLGYIGEKGNEKHEEVFEALPLKAKVHTVARLGEGETFAKFGLDEITHLEVEFAMASDKKEGIQSMNEDVLVKFDPVLHRYVYNGQELIGGTSYIKKWIKEFDKENISRMYAKSLGCKQSEVLEFWNNGGDVAGDYGSAIHGALEHYEKFKKLGKIIQGKKDLPFNKAMPSHPELRKIVEQFIEKFGDQEVETEVIVTNVERGLCGMIDRLLIVNEENLVCRVQDYKVNIDAAVEGKDKYLGQMAALPKNKLSKYRLQLSFYARLLELSGWTVEGLDAYVYEDEWKCYTLEQVKLDF